MAAANTTISPFHTHSYAASNFRTSESEASFLLNFLNAPLPHKDTESQGRGKQNCDQSEDEQWDRRQKQQLTGYGARGSR
jgi:hypothetical protein